MAGAGRPCCSPEKPEEPEKEEAIDAYPAALERHGVDTDGPAWWERRVLASAHLTA